MPTQAWCSLGHALSYRLTLRWLARAVPGGPTPRSSRYHTWTGPAMQCKRKSKCKSKCKLPQRSRAVIKLISAAIGHRTVPARHVTTNSSSAVCHPSCRSRLDISSASYLEFSLGRLVGHGAERLGIRRPPKTKAYRPGTNYPATDRRTGQALSHSRSPGSICRPTPQRLDRRPLVRLLQPTLVAWASTALHATA